MAAVGSSATVETALVMRVTVGWAWAAADKVVDTWAAAAKVLEAAVEAEEGRAVEGRAEMMAEAEVEMEEAVKVMEAEEGRAAVAVAVPAGMVMAGRVVVANEVVAVEEVLEGEQVEHDGRSTILSARDRVDRSARSA